MVVLHWPINDKGDSRCHSKYPAPYPVKYRMEFASRPQDVTCKRCRPKIMKPDGLPKDWGTLNFTVEDGDSFLDYISVPKEQFTALATRLEAAERMIDAVIDGKVSLGIKARQFFGEYRHKFSRPE